MREARVLGGCRVADVVGEPPGLAKPVSPPEPGQPPVTGEVPELGPISLPQRGPIEMADIATVRPTVSLDLTPGESPVRLAEGSPVHRKIAEVASQCLVGPPSVEHHLDAVPRREPPDIEANQHVQGMNRLVLVPKDAIEPVPELDGVDVDTMEDGLGTLDRLLNVDRFVEFRRHIRERLKRAIAGS